MSRLQIIKQTLIISLLVNTYYVYAKNITVANIIEPALSTDCIDYCVDGACFWLKCRWYGCSVEVTPHITHNLPDFIVTSYNNPGENPLQEVKLLDNLPKTIQGIDGGHLSTRKQGNSNIKFKEVSVIGNPVAVALSKQKYFCQTKVEPYIPYYLSTVDAVNWRSGLTEMLYPASFIPGMSEIGEPFDSWGPIYPRQGFLNQINDVKAAAVVAFRAIDIVTEGGVHIYQHSSGVLKKNGEWQMISPKQESSCKKFGNENDKALEKKVDKQGQYAWIAWREYNCCIPRSGTFIGSVITGCLN